MYSSGVLLLVLAFGAQAARVDLSQLLPEQTGLAETGALTQRRDLESGDGLKFTMAMGALKLDGLPVSAKAVKRIANILKDEKDDLVALMETDTSCAEGLALWARLRARLSEDYVDPAVEPLCQRMTEGRYYALTVLARRKSKVELGVGTGTEVLCRDGPGKPKGLLFRNVTVGDSGLLLVVGLAFSPDDDRKGVQIGCLLEEVARRRAAAAEAGRTLQVVTAGDANTRLVLPEGWGTEFVEKTAKGGKEETVWTRKLTDETQARLIRKLVNKKSRKELLTWDALLFDGIATDGSHVSPPQALEDLHASFFFMTDWWRKKDKTPAMVTYKRKPWFDQVSEDFLLWMRQLVPVAEDGSVSSSGKLILTTKELGKKLKWYIREKCGSLKYPEEEEACKTSVKKEMEEQKLMAGMSKHHKKNWLFKEKDLDEDIEELLDMAYFGMEDKIAKTGSRSRRVQLYLNHNGQNRAIYLQAGWLDVVAISREGFSTAKFKDFTNDMEIWSFDHTMVHARLEFEV